MIFRSPLKRGTKPIRHRRSSKRQRSLSSYITAKVAVPEDRSEKDPGYLDWLHLWPCVICKMLDVPQTSRTEAAHVGIHGSGVKCPDVEAIPLCGEHHRHGKNSHHEFWATAAAKTFWEGWGLDRDEVIARFRSKYAADMEESEWGGK